MRNTANVTGIIQGLVLMSLVFVAVALMLPQENVEVKKYVDLGDLENKTTEMFKENKPTLTGGISIIWSGFWAMITFMGDLVVNSIPSILIDVQNAFGIPVEVAVIITTAIIVSVLIYLISILAGRRGGM